ncbi:Ribosomal RNA large subunit methyltransferase H [Chlamydiales bacterium STE3]|nr:Ribosomal RNA large subunit methyltransferase H [Chlamydiales bacterium STE3]
MLKIRILSIGKTKEKWLEDALQEYLKRLSPVLTIDFLLFKNDTQLEIQASKENVLICLDPQGRLLSSEEFSQVLITSLERGGSKLSFVIGGAEGLPESLKKHPLISFSRMTFTHQICRLILVEQIYRAIELQKGSRYHK